MAKIQMGPKTYVFPMPVFLVGANVNNAPNFLPIAWGGIASSEPPMISLAVRPARYTMKGIMRNRTFSVNTPSADMVTETDFCGLESGARVDKVKACGFKVFYGKLGNAPLIEQCPVNLECSLEHSLELGSHTLLIGRIEETHVSESCLTDGRPDAAKIKPLIYTTAVSNYQVFGEVIAKAFSVGRSLKT